MANSWLSRLFVSRQRPGRRRPVSFETLENRTTPATFTVSNTLDSGLGSLRQAIADAAASAGPDTISFDPSLTAKTITLASNDANGSFGPTGLVIANDSITIDGSDAPGLILSGNGQRRLFAVASTGALTLENITLTAGLAQGENGQDGTVAGGGGAAGLGGAVYNQGTLTVLDSTLARNAAVGGNGGAASTTGTTGNGGGFGGAGGGAGSQGSSGVTTVLPGRGDDGVFASGGGGGAIGGIGGFGGGGGGNTLAHMPDDSGTLGGSGGVGGGGAGAGLGGAIFNDQGATLVLTDATLASNVASSGTPATGGNSASGAGGAIFNRDGTVTVNNTTIAGNIAASGGDGIYNYSDAIGQTAQLTLVSSIVASTATQNVVNTQAAGTASVLASAPNIVQSGIVGGGTIVATGVLTVDPQLETLANNGGPTQTMAPASTSPALGKGSNPLNLTTDQRSYAARTINGATDIGAFETGAKLPVSTPPAPPPPPLPTVPPAAIQNQTFVSNLYLTLLDRQADRQGLAYYAGRLNAGTSRDEVVREIMGGTEYQRDVVEQLYQTYLHRSADPQGLVTYMAFLQRGGSVEALREVLLSSDEYFVGSGGGTNEGFVTALYHDVFGRAPDAAGLAAYERMLSTVSRGLVAQEFISSKEGSQDRVQQIYQALLVRPADASGLQTYSDVLIHGGSEASIIEALASSSESWSQPARK